MSGSREASGVTGVQLVIVSRRPGIGGYSDCGSGGGTGGDGYGRLIRWEDNVSNLILGTYPNVPLVYAPGLEIHHPIMSIIGVY